MDRKPLVSSDKVVQAINAGKLAERVPANRLPVKPVETLVPRPSVRSLVRACAASAMGIFEKADAIAVLKDVWPHDDGAKWLLTRAPSVPADMTNAPAMVQQIMPDFVSTLATASAAARVFKEGLVLKFDGAGRIAVPTLLGSPSYAAFVAESGAIPVAQGHIEPLVFLTPRKIAIIVVLTDEMIKSSNAEALIRDALVRSAGLTLDSVMFDANPGDAARPPGLRYNVPPLTASASTDKSTALLDDVETLHLDLEPVTPKSPAMYVMSPTRAVMAELRSPHGLDPLTIVGSYAFHGTNIVSALAPDIMVSAFGDVPEIEASREGAVQMDTTPPVDISTATSRTSSMWQTDCVAIKLRLPVSWALRSDVGLAWLTATNW